MPDTRTHRGPHPEDAALFTPGTLPTLRRAVADMSWLLSHGYADTSTLKLVGDRYELTKRQRMAVMRAACSDEHRQLRRRKCVSPAAAAGNPLLIDGYNVLITTEAALGRAPVFIARDGCIRDIAGLHGTYRKVNETLPAIEAIAAVLNRLAPSQTIWLLDKPVSNSGRLKKIILDHAAANHLPWQVELVQNPDKLLIETKELIATSDSIVLDNCTQWLNLAAIIIERLACDHDVNLLNLAAENTEDTEFFK